ncbi:MAG: hypothetical protein RR951_03030, partial [Ruthenibacterium sp.]
MKKILPKLALALLPLAAYFALFLAFEPNNYFGLRKNVSTNNPISRIRAYEAAPQSAIILGDSRMAHFDMALVNQTAGRPYANVAYGGAGLDESIDEFYYLYGKNPFIDKVVFGLSFYTLNAAYKPVNRMSTVATQLANPAAYVFNLEYNVNTITVMADRLRYALRGEAYTDLEETAEHSPAEYADADGALPARADLIDYAATLYANCAAKGVSLLPPRVYDADGNLSNAREISAAAAAVTPADSKFRLNTHALARLAELSAFCAQHNISLTFVLPPMDESVRALVTTPLGIEAAMQPALAALAATGAQVLDYEWTKTQALP